MLSEKQINELKSQLEKRLLDIRKEIKQELLASGHEKIAGQVHDIGDESLVDMLDDINYAMIGHHIQEVKEIESALLMIESGEYGICVDCGIPIKYKRLKVQPTAIRCINCQAAYEANNNHSGQQPH